MDTSDGSRALNRSSQLRQITARSLLISSGVVKKCKKESLMIRLQRRIAQWSLLAVKAIIGTVVLVDVEIATAGPLTPPKPA